MKAKRLAGVFSFLFLFLLTSTIQAAGPQILRGHVPAVVARMMPQGTLPETNRLNLAISLPLRNQAALSNLLSQIYDPASPNYHHYLTPEQFTEQFGPTEKDYQAVIAFAQANGLSVTATYPNRMLLDVSATAAQIERTLHLTLNVYRHPTENRNFYAPSTEPSLDLSVPILHISGLDNYELPRPHLVAKPLVNTQNASPNSGSGPGGTYMGKDFRAAYVPDSTRDGTGQMVGLLEFDGYSASDINYYENQAGLPNIPLQNVLIDGASGGPQNPDADVEVALDIEVAISMATNLSKMVVYIAPNGAPFEDVLNSMVSSNQVKQFSCSWYILDGTAQPAADQIWEQMAAQGQSFLNASGDSCAYTGLISFPGDSPYITQVGGTTLSTTGPGGAWSSETVWNWGIEYGSQYNGVGSSGGVSTQYPIPSWQTNISMTASQGSTTMRNTPDVAMTADNIYVRVDGGNVSVGGTSCAAPLWAGFAALANQQAAVSGRPSIGFINPALDAIGTGPNYTTDFHDITTGNNTWSGSPSKFYAVAGYDLCTGWGTPAGQKLINDLANPEPLVITPSSGFVSTGGVGGPFTVTSEELSLTNFGTNTLTWTLTNTSQWLNASSIGGILTPGGPATVVTVSLNNIASNLVVGTYNATLGFTNENDGNGQGVSFELNVIAPPTITSQPTNQAVLEGEAAGFKVSATGGLPLSYQWHLNGTNLTDGGNISGSQTTNLTISDVSSADVGDYSVTATNLAGMATSSNATLSIVPSAPVIIVQPANETAVVGQTADFSVTAVGNMPLFYQWSYNGTKIIGATNSLYSIPDVQITNAGTFSVVITNALGSTSSSNAVLTVLPTPPCDPPPSGIVSWWPGEGNADDVIGTNNGILGGSISFASGKVGEAFLYTTTNDDVRIPASQSLDVGEGSGFTVEAWVNPTDVSLLHCIFEWNNGSSFGVHFYISPDPAPGTLYANVVDSSGGLHEMSSSTSPMITNVFQHVALTYDQASGNATLYYNGVIVGQQNLGSYTPRTSYDLYLGRRPPGIDSTWTFSGLIDEPSLYNRALSSNEIAAIYNAGSGGKCPPAPTPPVIVTQPTNQTVALGGTASLSVAATGSQPLSYQWTFDGANLPGATSATLTLPDAQFSQAGTYAVAVSNLFGSTISSNATLTVYGVPPFITIQPANQMEAVGGTASFSVVAGGTSPLNYQWNFDGTNLPGATNAALTLANVQFSQAGTYEVTITNPYGSTNSTGAILSVYGVPPSITTPPANQIAALDGTASFNVVAGGSVPLSYQWSFDGTSLPGATNATLTLNDVQLDQSGTYAVAVTNLYGSTNVSATLTVYSSGSCDPPPSGIVSWWPGEGNANDIIGTNNGVLQGSISFGSGEVGQAFLFTTTNDDVRIPASQSLNVGEGSGFTLEAWINPADVQLHPIFEWNNGSGGFGAQLYISTDSGPGSLYANVVDSGGGWHQMHTPTAPVVTNKFQHVALTYDQASGLATIYYNGAIVAQQNLGSYTPLTSYDLYLGRRPPGAAGTYSFVGLIDEPSLYSRALSSNEIAAIYIAGSAGKCSSTPPTPPSIEVQPTNETVLAGSITSLVVVAEGTAPLSYQWNFDGTNLPGATNAALTLTNVQPANAGVYNVTVDNAYGSVVSSNAILTVYGIAPFITTRPTNEITSVGQTIDFGVVAGGSTPLSYQWSFDGIIITGATNTTLTLTNVQYGEAGTYAVTVTNLFGSTNVSATLTVYAPGSCDPPPSGIVSWWPGEGNANDIIGTNNGILQGSISFAPGEVGEAFLYTTTNDDVRIPASQSLDVGEGSGFTLEGWINPTDVSLLHCIFEFNNGSNSFGVHFYVSPDPAPGTLYANVVNSNGVLNEMSSSTSPVTTNVFQHVALTYDQASGNATLYYNGTIAGQQNIGSFTPRTSYDLYIGRRPPGIDSTWTFSGLIDEPSLYNRALSSNEIAAIYNAGTAGKCRPFSLPTITVQPTNLTVSAANNATFSVVATGTVPLSYQWMFNGSNLISGATNPALVLANVQFANEGLYSAKVTNPYGSVTSSNALLIVTVDHFAWNAIPSPRFVNSPFQVEIIAQDAANGVFTNYTGIVYIGSTNGIPVSPTVSSNFVQGIWTGTIAVSQTTTNLVLSATDGSGHSGLANPVNVVNLPQLTTTPSGGTLYISWPASTTGFVLETSTNLASGNWQPVTAPPLQFGDQYVQPITLTGTNNNVFYRLQYSGP